MQGIYSDINNFDNTKMLTLELYTQPTQGTLFDAGYKETHTFANMMANPICTIGFMQQESPQKNYFDPAGNGTYNDFIYGIHYELRAIPKVIHCWAPEMGNEYDVFDYKKAEDPDAIFGSGSISCIPSIMAAGQTSHPLCTTCASCSTIHRLTREGGFGWSLK